MSFFILSLQEMLFFNVELFKTRLMEIKTFIANYKAAFGENTELPIVFWYSDTLENQTEKINGLNADVIGCGGGKFYTGFTDMPERVPTFVSLKEKYKETPEMVIEYIDRLGVTKTENRYLHFARMDKVDSLDLIEGVLFLATPDILSGLVTWACYDNNSEDAVVTQFGSGCSVTVTQTILENHRGGRRTFIGFFDPSVRPYFEPDILSYTVPMSRFKEMYHTMRSSCLFDTHAWGKIKERIQLSDK